MAFATTGEKKLIDCFTGEANAATYYVGLVTDSGGLTEVTGTSYARVSVGAAGSSFDAATGSAPTCEAVNASEISFPESGGAWNSGSAISYAGLYDAASAGNLLAVITLSSSVTVSASGQTVKFAAGALTISVT